MTTQQLILSSSLAAMLLGASAFAAGPCETADHRAFDFWVGEWNVYGKGGKLVGENSITREFNGCLIHEHYSTPGGYSGESLNAYDRGRKVWTQTWVDSGGLVLKLEGGLEGDSMVLEGKTVNRQAREISHRITWTPGEDGEVRQHWQSSAAGGEWKTLFDGTYRRK